jgi:hypothetical protein
MSRIKHPVRALREPFGTAGLIVACVALVLALTGAAFAAGKLTSTQKKEVEKIAKKFAGKPGAVGPAGPAGPAGAAGANGKDGAPGAKGEDGTDGTNGTNGTDGESVTMTPLSAPECNPTEEGGARFEVGGQEVEVCNGKAGSPWTAGGTLPKGSTEVGVWAGVFAENALTGGKSNAKAAISFGIPLSAAPTVGLINSGGEEAATFNSGTHEWEFTATPQHCHGSVSAPTAPEGYLCIYAEHEGAGGQFEEEQPAYTAGALVQFWHGFAPGFFANGTWAVTAG